MGETLDLVKFYHRVLGMSGVLSAFRGRLKKRQILFQTWVPGIPAPIYLRVPSSDVRVFYQIFRKAEYLATALNPPDFVVDAGANIGLASIYFANEFPNARILAIEPEQANFEILVKNVAPYPNIVPIQGALWGSNTEIEVVDAGLGNWGFMTEAQSSAKSAAKSAHQTVKGMTIDSILEEHGIERISILKIDIEGAELEVFRNSSSWIERVDSLIVELHERMKPGCNRTFYRATSGFDTEWHRGEYVYLTRTGGCLVPAESNSRW